MPSRIPVKLLVAIKLQHTIGTLFFCYHEILFCCNLLYNFHTVFPLICPPFVMQQQLLTVNLMSDNNITTIINNNDKNKYSMVSRPLSFIFFHIENNHHSSKKNLIISPLTNQRVSHSGCSHHGL